MPRNKNTSQVKLYTTPERAEYIRRNGGATKVLNALIDEQQLLPLIEGIARDLADIRAAITDGAQIVKPRVVEPEDASLAEQLAGMTF